MKKTIQEKRLALLEDTCQHFNSTNRSTKSDTNGCYYQPQHENTQGCAIGRLIKSKKLRILLDGNQFEDTTVDYVFDYLPKNLQIYGMEFLLSLQKLHDDASLWNKNGLNKEGKIAKEYLITKHCK
jgi:hypothetical protein